MSQVLKLRLSDEKCELLYAFSDDGPGKSSLTKSQAFDVTKPGGAQFEVGGYLVSVTKAPVAKASPGSKAAPEAK